MLNFINNEVLISFIENKYCPFKLLHIEKTNNVIDDSFVKNLNKQYKKRCLKYHPDKHINSSPDDKEKAAQKFIMIQLSYHILSNNDTFNKYNDLLSQLSTKNFNDLKSSKQSFDFEVEQISKEKFDDIYNKKHQKNIDIFNNKPTYNNIDDLIKSRNDMEDLFNYDKIKTEQFNEEFDKFIKTDIPVSDIIEYTGSKFINSHNNQLMIDNDVIDPYGVFDCNDNLFDEQFKLISTKNNHVDQNVNIL